MLRANKPPFSGGVSRGEGTDIRTQAIEVKHAKGKALSSTIFQSTGKKLLARGHVISEEDANLLRSEGVLRVWVAELDEGETGEDTAALKVAGMIGCGSVEIRPAVAGKANLLATEPSCTLIDHNLLNDINSRASIVIATPRNFSFAPAGQRIAIVKSAPFAVSASDLDALTSILKARGPILQARPIRKPGVGILYTDPTNTDRPREFFTHVMRQRLNRFGASANFVLSSLEEEDAIARCLGRLLEAKPTCILIASTTAPAGPDDPVGRGIIKAGCSIEHFLAPVEPGHLLLLGYKGEVPIVSAPGCFRSASPNVLDLILPAMLARYKLASWEIAGLGHGGLLS